MNGPGIIRPRQRQPSPAVPSYTIIAVGQRCVGKSSLLRLLLDTLPLSPYATHDQLRSIANFASSSNPFSECHLEVLWDNERLLLHLIDTPPLNGEDALPDIISVIEERYIRGAHTDTDDGDSSLGESHVHLCLYLLDALQPDFRHDIDVISRLSTRINVLPLLARSDVLTLNGLINFKQSIRAKLADAGLGFGIFDTKQGEAGIIPTRHSAFENARSLPLLPYAIFTPEHSKLAYEPVLNSWMDKLDRRRAECQSSDMKMDVDRKLDESSLSSSSSSIHCKAPSSRGSGSPAPAGEPVHKPDSGAVPPTANDNGKPTPSPAVSSRTDEKSNPPTPPIADPSVPIRTSSPPSALKDSPGSVRINSDITLQLSSVPNAADAATHDEAEPKSADTVHDPDRMMERPLSASSPQNGFHSEVKVSPSINNIPLNSKVSPTSEVQCPTGNTDQKHQISKIDSSQQSTLNFSNDSELVLEKFVRVMRWGVLDCIDNRQSDFVRLRDEIMAWRKELKAYTREYLYCRFKDDSFSRLAAQVQQPPHQREVPLEALLTRHESLSRDCTYRVSPPPLPHGLRCRSTSFTQSVAERERQSMSRLPSQYLVGRDHESCVSERERGLDHRYPHPRDKIHSPEREKDYHAPRLSPQAAAVMSLSNERKRSVPNGGIGLNDRPKYRDPKHDQEWEDQQQRHPVLLSIDRDRCHRISPNSHAPSSHCHPDPYPPQYNHDHVRDKEHFERERGRERISPSMRERERDMISPPLQRPGSPGAPVSIGMPAGQHGQGYGSNIVNPNISPNLASGGKQLDVHSLLNHNHHGAVPGIITQGLGERREREHELSPNSATVQSSSGMPLGLPISTMSMPSGPTVGGVVGLAGGPTNNISPPVPNAGLNSTGRKRKITMACNFCRSRKLKCDGVKPACAQCIKRTNICDYQQHAVAPPPQGPTTVPTRDASLNPSQARDLHSGQTNVILPSAYVSSSQLTSPGLRHREREYTGSDRDRDAPFYHSARPYSPPPPPPPPGSNNHGHHPYLQQSYPPHYSRLREGSPPPPPQHHTNAQGATHTWRYTSQSHAQAHAAARDSDVDELMEDFSEHEDRNSDMRSRGMKSGQREYAHVVYEQSNGHAINSSSSTNGRKRVSVDMLIVEALGEGGPSSGPLEEDRTGSAVGTNGGRNRDGVKDRENGQEQQQQQHPVNQPQNQPPPSGQGGQYEAGSWYEMSVGVIDVGSEGDKKKRLNRQSANYGSKAVACVHCRARKTRCDAVRPACGNCARRSLSCSYNHTTPSQPRTKGKKAAAAAAAAAASSSSNSNSNAGSTSGVTSNGHIEHDMKPQQRNNVHHHPQANRSPSHSGSPGQVGTPHPLPSWHHTQSHQNHSHSGSHPHPHPHPSHSPIRVDDHRLPIEESAERERPLTRSPQPPIATLNVPERSRSRSSSGSLSTKSMMENGSAIKHHNHHNASGMAGGISRSRSASNFAGPNIVSELAGVKRKSPDAAESLDANVERRITLDERSREQQRPDKRRKPWVENVSNDAPAAHLTNQVRVQ